MGSGIGIRGFHLHRVDLGTEENGPSCLDVGVSPFVGISFWHLPIPTNSTNGTLVTAVRYLETRLVRVKAGHFMKRRS